MKALEMDMQTKQSDSIRNINKIINRITAELNIQKKTSQSRISIQNTQKSTELSDPVCYQCKYRSQRGACRYEDIGFVPVRQSDGFADKLVECDLHKKQQIKRLWEKSGIIKNDFTFKNFKEITPDAKSMKAIALDYVINFDKIKNTKHNSLALLGQPGCGKTHLCMAIANHLVNKKAIEVTYLPFREVIPVLKQCNNAMNAEIYQRKINKYKTTPVLFIDDLFKKGKSIENSTTDADVKIMFEIINYRYFNMRPIVVSSELFFDELNAIDNGTESRIYQMCKEHRIEVERSIENDYRHRDED